MSKRIIPLLLFFDGSACMGLAAGAHALGLDPNPAWGGARYALLLLGASLIGASLLSTKWRAPARIASILNSESVKTIAVLAHLWGLILLIYIWFITFGTFTSWTHTSHYYTRLADAFAQGQLHVDLPPGSLLDAADPYDPASRAPFRDDIWDMSFYNEKLYFYWGPAPSLLLAPIQSLTGIQASDSQLVFWFLAGLLLFNSLSILKLWRRFFPALPAWNVFLCIALIGLILPVPWEASAPYVYAVAVTAGAFFLMGGLYFILPALDDSSFLPARDLCAAGFFWACAVGSRAILAIPVIFMSLVILARILTSLPAWKDWKRAAAPVLALFAPLAIGALLIGWYNWARFDSPFEFGVRYQITTYNFNQRGSEIFQLAYVWRNLHAYLLQPFHLIREFPFIQPGILAENSIQAGANAASIYYTGRLAGILPGMPFLLFGFAPIFLQHIFFRPGLWTLKHFVLLLAGSSLTCFISLLFYFNAQTRFLMDVISPFSLLAILGYWMTVSRLSRIQSRVARAAILLTASVLICTILAGILLSVTGETGRLENFNPGLFYEIRAFLPSLHP
ncbi:MAG: hypothetical protein HFACDABA_02202 [Anaerolineales bacterium]|nr:hypothetical protein [Anaerolineales bacterium]